MRLSFEDEANEEIACGREYTPFPRRSLRVAGTAKLVVVAVRQASEFARAGRTAEVEEIGMRRHLGAIDSRVPIWFDARR